MIHVLIEGGYESNNRTRKILEGISSVARKRHEDAITYGAVADIPTDATVAIVLAQSVRWVSHAVGELCFRGIHPLLFGFDELDVPHKYSSICPAYTKSAYRLTRYAMSEQAGKCAILGYNPDSVPDRLKYTGIRRAINEAGAEYRVYKNSGNLEECLAEFAAECEDITNVICCNGNVAVALYVKHRELLSGRRLYSCSALKICELLEVPCPTCKIDYLTAGAELARLYFFLKKEGGDAPCVMSVDLDTDFPYPESDGTDAGEEQREVDFWGDVSLGGMERLDKMLTECDRTDLSLLSGLIRGKTYEKLAEELFISEGTVKYRLKKLFELSETQSKKELIELIREYRIKL